LNTYGLALELEGVSVLGQALAEISRQQRVNLHSYASDENEIDQQRRARGGGQREGPAAGARPSERGRDEAMVPIAGPSWSILKINQKRSHSKQLDGRLSNAGECSQ
jgi:hypothetical protein